MGESGIVSQYIVAQASPPESHHCHSPSTTHVVSSDLDSAKQSAVHGKLYSSIETIGRVLCLYTFYNIIIKIASKSY